MNTDSQETSIVHILSYHTLPEKNYIGRNGKPFEMPTSKTEHWEVGDALMVGDYGVRIQKIERDGNNVHVYVYVEYKDDSTSRFGGSRYRGD